jgi:4-hydroxybenzoate polyprenyltransferase
MNIKKELIEGWNETPNSVKFWNSLVLLLLIIVGIINMGLLYILLSFGSLLALGIMIDGDDSKHHLWMFLMPITWLLIFLSIIIGLFYFFYLKVITPFNDWLNEEKDI